MEGFIMKKLLIVTSALLVTGTYIGSDYDGSG